MHLVHLSVDSSTCPPENKTNNDQPLGFRVALGSDISPEDLASCGFEMKQFVFHPSKFEAVSTLIDLRFTVVDVSVGCQPAYAFVRNQIVLA